MFLWKKKVKNKQSSERRGAKGSRALFLGVLHQLIFPGFVQLRYLVVYLLQLELKAPEPQPFRRKQEVLLLSMQLKWKGQHTVHPSHGEMQASLSH